MSDIVKRLRATHQYSGIACNTCLEAADVIERLRVENEAMIATLKEPDQVGYWQRRYEISTAEIERLRAINSENLRDFTDDITEKDAEIERLLADGLRTAMKRLAAWIPPNARAPLKLP